MSYEGEDIYRDDDSFEEVDFEFEEQLLNKEASKKYREYMLRRTVAKDYIKQIEQENELGIIEVNVVTDIDADMGLLSDCGGYYQVIKIDARTLKKRRDIISTLTYRLLLKLNKITVPDFDSSNFQEATLYSKLNSNLVVHKYEAWKDFQSYLMQKYLTCTSYTINKIYNSAIKDEFHTDYIAFLVSKSRFIFHSTYLDDTLTDFKYLHSSTTKHIFEKSAAQDNIIYKKNFLTEVKKAASLRVFMHEEAFKNFSCLSTLNLNSSRWKEEDNKIYIHFLALSYTISNIELDTNYNISYISKVNDQRVKLFAHKVTQDAVLEFLKKVMTSLTIQLSEVCKSWKRISLIKKNMNIDTHFLQRFLDAAGCNYFSFGDGDSFKMVIQTTLGNILILSTPIEIFEPKYFVCKDISFCRINFNKYTPVNKVTEIIKPFQDKMFMTGIERTEYDSFILTYYAKLSNIPSSYTENWIKKMRKLKAKILATSSYCRHISAIRIQQSVRRWRSDKKLLKPFLDRHLKEKMDAYKELLAKQNDVVFQTYLENFNSKVITRFFRNIILSKQNKPIRDLYKSTLSSKRLALQKKLQFGIEQAKQLRQKLKIANYNSATRYNIFESSKSLKLSNTYNNDNFWFGFRRNNSLINLFLSTGNDVKLLEVKTSYNFNEFMQILTAVSDICACTKSYQFVKLCRSLSGTKHKGNTLKDFCQGFCWMFKKIDKFNFLKMANMFCKSTNNNKFMVYLVNNVDNFIETLDTRSIFQK